MVFQMKVLLYLYESEWDPEIVWVTWKTEKGNED